MYSMPVWANTGTKWPFTEGKLNNYRFYIWASVIIWPSTIISVLVCRNRVSLPARISCLIFCDRRSFSWKAREEQRATNALSKRYRRRRQERKLSKHFRFLSGSALIGRKPGGKKEKTERKIFDREICCCLDMRNVRLRKFAIIIFEDKFTSLPERV